MEEHCRQINRAIIAKDYMSLAHLLTLFSGKQLMPKLMNDLNHSSSLAQLVSVVACVADDYWRELVLNHFRALKAKFGVKQQAKQIFSCQYDAVQVFLRDLFGKGDKSMLPVLYVLCRDLWICTLTDPEVEEEDEEEVARVINKAFTLCITDRSPLEHSRKHGCFKILSLLMIIYFHRRQLNLCVQLLRALKTAELPHIKLFPKSHVVSFYYYHGRFLAASGQYAEACNQLSLALKATYSAHLNGSSVAMNNLHKILLFFIPVHVICFPHRMPKINQSFIPEKFKLAFQLLSLGKIASYREYLNANFEWFAKHDLFILFQRFEIIAIRNLVWRVQSFLDNNSKTRIPLQLIYAMCGGEKVWTLGIEQLGCHLCSLISLGVIRGYVSLAPPFLVVSSKEPFPAFCLNK